MKIDSIRIRNFRQFHGSIEIQFSNDTKKNVTVIHGSNGSGKTSLLNAFKWCFYGKTDFDTGNETILNEAAIESASVGETVELEIAVKFIHENRRFQATRSQRFKKEDSLRASSLDDGAFSLDITGEDGQTIQGYSAVRR